MKLFPLAIYSIAMMMLVLNGCSYEKPRPEVSWTEALDQPSQITPELEAKIFGNRILIEEHLDENSQVQSTVLYLLTNKDGTRSWHLMEERESTSTGHILLLN